MKAPTQKQYDMSSAVLQQSMKIKSVALAFAVSPSTVRRAMDVVSEFERTKFNLELDGQELKQVLGWLRNGNWSACDLADSIEERLQIDNA